MGYVKTKKDTWATIRGLFILLAVSLGIGYWVTMVSEEAKQKLRNKLAKELATQNEQQKS